MVHGQFHVRLARDVLLEAATNPTRRPQESSEHGHRRRAEPDALSRSRRRSSGPVFNRVWDTPDNGYAEKFKHSIEPVLTINRTSSVDNIDQIVKLDGIDNFIGGTTAHLRAQQPVLRQAQDDAGRAGGIARDLRRRAVPELLHRTRTRRSTTPMHQTTLGVQTIIPINFSPIALNFRALPTDAINANASRGVRRALSQPAHDFARKARIRGPTACRSRAAGASAGISRRFLCSTTAATRR